MVTITFCNWPELFPPPHFHTNVRALGRTCCKWRQQPSLSATLVRRILHHAISVSGGSSKTAFTCHPCPRFAIG
jgi:hypothetical protein